MDSDTLYDLLYNSVLYITPSTFEGFGMTAVEAIFHKVPVISSTQEALMEVTFSNAFYYKPNNDEKKLADAILKVLDNYPDDLYLERLKEKALRSFHYIEIAKEYLTFFRKISNKVFYVDPMSYHNLALYDYNLLKNINDNLSITFYGNKLYAIEETGNMEKIYDYSMYSSKVMKTFSYISSQLKLLIRVRKEKCKIVHLQWSKFPNFDFYFIKYLKKKNNIKFIYTSHNTFFHGSEKEKSRIFLKLMKLADHIFVHTDNSREILEKYNLKNISIVKHGLLDIGKSYPAKDVDFKKSNRITFSLLGNMKKYKGTDLLLKAWLSSEKLVNNKKISLLVLGKNAMDYKPVIGENVNIVYRDETRPDNEFTKWMELTDVLVLPYQRISQSGLLLSALSMKKLLIVNDVGELSKPVREHSLGWVINESTVTGLRSSLERIVDEIERCGLKQINIETSERIELDYGWEETGRITSAVYDNI